MAQQQLVKHAVTYRGREYQVQEKPELEDLECCICLQLAYDPCQTSCCGQTLCAGCSNKLPLGKPCPYCRSTRFQVTRDARIKRKIRSLTAYCPNRSDGCNWLESIVKVNNHLEKSCLEQVIHCPYTGCVMRMKRKNFANHTKTCPAYPMKCPNYCATGKKLTRSNLQYHLKTICPEQVIPCLFAGCTVIVKRKKMNAHMKTCPAHPVTCPNLCVTREEITRSTLQDHLNICPEEIISCQFAGCMRRVKRKQMAKHIEECPAHPVTCPNHCATDEKLTRSTLQDHLEDNCPEQVISCLFAEDGCTVRVKRREMDDHLNNNCPEQVISCQFEEAGCTVRVERKKNG